MDSDSNSLDRGKNGDSGSEMSDEVYIEKRKRLQKYVPFLKRVIDTLTSKTKDSSKDLHLSKIKSLLELLTNKKKRVNIKFLIKSEIALETLHKKYNANLNRLLANKSFDKISNSKGATLSSTHIKIEDDKDFQKECAKKIADEKIETQIKLDTTEHNLEKNESVNNSLDSSYTIQNFSRENVGVPKKLVPPSETNIDVMIVSSDDEDVVIVSSEKLKTEPKLNPVNEYSDISDNEPKFFSDKVIVHKIEGLSDISDVENFEKDMNCSRENKNDGRSKHSRRKRRDKKKSRSTSKDKHSRHKDKSYHHEKSKDRQYKSRKSLKDYAERQSKSREKCRGHSKERSKYLPLDVLSRKFLNIDKNLNIVNNSHKDRVTPSLEKSKPLPSHSSTGSLAHKKGFDLSVSIHKNNQNYITNKIVDRQTDIKSSSPNVDFYAGHNYFGMNDNIKPKEVCKKVRSTKTVDSSISLVRIPAVSQNGTNDDKILCGKIKSKDLDINMNLLEAKEGQINSEKPKSPDQIPSETVSDDIEKRLNEIFVDRVDSEKISELLKDEEDVLCSTVNDGMDLANAIFGNIEDSPPSYSEEVCVVTTENEGRVTVNSQVNSCKDQNLKEKHSKVIKEEQNTTEIQDENGNSVPKKETIANKLNSKTSDSTKNGSKQSSSKKDRKKDEKRKHSKNGLKSDNSRKQSKDRHARHAEKHSVGENKDVKDTSVQSSSEKLSHSKHKLDIKSSVSNDKHKSHTKSNVNSCHTHKSNTKSLVFSDKVPRIKNQEVPSPRHNPEEKCGEVLVHVVSSPRQNPAAKCGEVTVQLVSSPRQNTVAKSSEIGVQVSKDVNVQINNLNNKIKSEKSSKVKHSQSNTKKQMESDDNTKKPNKATEGTKKQRTHSSSKSEKPKLLETTKEDTLKVEKLKQCINLESTPHTTKETDKINEPSLLHTEKLSKSEKNCHKKEHMPSQKQLNPDSDKLSKNLILTKTSSERCNHLPEVCNMKERRKSQKSVENLGFEQPRKNLESSSSNAKHTKTRELITNQILEEVAKEDMWNLLLSNSQVVAQIIERMKKDLAISDEDLSKDDILMIKTVIEEKCLCNKAEKDKAAQTQKNTKKPPKHPPFSRELHNLHEDIKENMDDDVFCSIGRRLSSINAEKKTRSQFLHNDDENSKDSSRNNDKTPQKDKQQTQTLKRRKSMFCEDPTFFCYPAGETKEHQDKQQRTFCETIKKRRQSTIFQPNAEVGSLRELIEQSKDKIDAAKLKHSKCSSVSDEQHLGIKKKVPPKRRKSMHQERLHWDDTSITDPDYIPKGLQKICKPLKTVGDEAHRGFESTSTLKEKNSGEVTSNKEIKRNAILRRRKSMFCISELRDAKQRKIQNQTMEDNNILPANQEKDSKFMYFESLNLKAVLKSTTLSEDDGRFIPETHTNKSDDGSEKEQILSDDITTSGEKKPTPKICLKRNAANPFTWTSSLSHDESTCTFHEQLEKYSILECEVALVRLEEDDIIKNTKDKVCSEQEIESTVDSEIVTICSGDKEEKREIAAGQGNVSFKNEEGAMDLVLEKKEKDDVIISSTVVSVDNIPIISLDSDDESDAESRGNDCMIISPKALKSPDPPKASFDYLSERTIDLCNDVISHSPALADLPKPIALIDKELTAVSTEVESGVATNAKIEQSIGNRNVETLSNGFEPPTCVPVEVIISPLSNNLGTGHIYIPPTASETMIRSAVSSVIKPMLEPFHEREVYTEQNVAAESDTNISMIQGHPVEATSIALQNNDVAEDSESHLVTVEELSLPHFIETSEVPIPEISLENLPTVTAANLTTNNPLDSGPHAFNPPDSRQISGAWNLVSPVTTETSRISSTQAAVTSLSEDQDVVVLTKHAEAEESYTFGHSSIITHHGSPNSAENLTMSYPLEQLQNFNSSLEQNAENLSLRATYEGVVPVSERKDNSPRANISPQHRSETSCADISLVPQKTGSVIMKVQGIRRKISAYRRNSGLTNNNSTHDTSSTNNTPNQSSPITSPGPTVYQVASTGYSFVSPSEQSFHCLVQNCQFVKTRIIGELYEHFIMQHHDIKSSSPCKTCGRLLSTDNNIIGIADEIRHIKMYHNSCIFIRKDLNSSTTATTSQQVQSCETSANRQNEFSSTSSTEVVATRNDNGNKEKHSTAMNLLTTKSPVLAILKPWTNKSKSIKSVDQCIEMLRKEDMVNTFKCMGDNCVFSTPSVDPMSQHLHWHQGENRSPHNNNSFSWLECAYCDSVSLDFNDLLQHVILMHPRCDFQCMKCFYRGQSAEDLCNHARAYHSPPPFCDLNRVRKNPESVHPALIRNRRATVCAPLAPIEENRIEAVNQNLRSPLICPECPYQSQNVQELAHHTAISHRHQSWQTQQSAVHQDQREMQRTAAQSGRPQAVVQRDLQRPVEFHEWQPTQQMNNVSNTFGAVHQNIAGNHYTIHHKHNTASNQNNLQRAYNSNVMERSSHAPGQAVTSSASCNPTSSHTHQVFRYPEPSALQLPPSGMKPSHTDNHSSYNPHKNHSTNNWGREAQVNVRTANPPPYPAVGLGASQMTYAAKPTKTSPSNAPALHGYLASRGTAPNTSNHEPQIHPTRISPSGAQTLHNHLTSRITTANTSKYEAQTQPTRISPSGPQTLLSHLTSKTTAPNTYNYGAQTHLSSNMSASDALRREPHMHSGHRVSPPDLLKQGGCAQMPSNIASSRANIPERAPNRSSNYSWHRPFQQAPPPLYNNNMRTDNQPNITNQWHNTNPHMTNQPMRRAQRDYTLDSSIVNQTTENASAETQHLHTGSAIQNTKRVDTYPWNWNSAPNAQLRGQLLNNNPAAPSVSSYNPVSNSSKEQSHPVTNHLTRDLHMNQHSRHDSTNCNLVGSRPVHWSSQSSMSKSIPSFNSHSNSPMEQQPRPITNQLERDLRLNESTLVSTGRQNAHNLADPGPVPASQSSVNNSVSTCNSNSNFPNGGPHVATNQLTGDLRAYETTLDSNEGRNSNNRHLTDPRSIHHAAQSSVNKSPATSSIENTKTNVPVNTSSASPLSSDGMSPINISLYFDNPSSKQTETGLICVVENGVTHQSTTNPKSVNTTMPVNNTISNAQTDQQQGKVHDLEPCSTNSKEKQNCTLLNGPSLISPTSVQENTEERESHPPVLSATKQKDLLHNKTLRFVPEALLFTCPRKECQESNFEDAESLAIHLSVQHPKQKSHACKFCNTRSSNFIDHLLFHSKVIFSCCDGDFQHHSYKHVGHHAYYVHGDREQRILIISRGNGIKKELFNFLNYKNEQFWKCHICDRVTDSSYDYVAKHIAACHPNAAYDCRHCYFSTKHKNALEIHHTSAHPREALELSGANPRPIVNLKNSTFTKILEACIAQINDVSQKDVCSTSPRNTDSHVLTCKYCLAYFPKLEFMMCHWRDEHGPSVPFQFSISKKIACSYCTLNASFDYLKDHHFKTHSTVPFKIGNNIHCEENLWLSSLDVITQSLLDQLLREGIPSISQKCTACNIIFKEEDSILRHVEQVHSNEKVPFEKYTEKCILFGCNLCEIFYNNETDIIKHIIEHICSTQVEVNFCIDFYKINCVVLFENGLILRKDELTNTKYGSIKTFCNLMNLPHEINGN